MAGNFDARTITLTTPNPAATVTGGFALKSDYAELIGFRASCVTDNSSILKITDAAGKVVFLDAGGIDYTTVKDTVIGQDATVTGLSLDANLGVVDSTGAARTLAGGRGPLVKGPLTIEWSSNGTAGDVMTFRAYYRIIQYRPFSFTIADPAATTETTVNLDGKYVQILGGRIFVTTDNATRLRIRDADNRIVYLDAADKDYTTAQWKEFVLDDTLTGLTPQHLDATGVAATATSVAPSPVCRTPIKVAIVNNATASDPITGGLFYIS